MLVGPLSLCPQTDSWLLEDQVVVVWDQAQVAPLAIFRALLEQSFSQSCKAALHFRAEQQTLHL
jgi:hypothetical protein